MFLTLVTVSVSVTISVTISVTTDVVVVVVVAVVDTVVVAGDVRPEDNNSSDFIDFEGFNF